MSSIRNFAQNTYHTTEIHVKLLTFHDLSNNMQSIWKCQELFNDTDTLNWLRVPSKESVWDCSRSSLEMLGNSDISSMLLNFFSLLTVFLHHCFATAMAVSAVRRFKSSNTASKHAYLLLIYTHLLPHTTFNIR